MRGTTVPNEWGLPLIIARNPDKLYAVYETTSGSPLLRHKVRQMAIQGSLDQISNYGIDLNQTLDRQVHRHVRPADAGPTCRPIGRSNP